ncbi:hypothetical protein NLM33_44205 [Bradyrhizobium sp. CCGUVB1N3]|uniref:hypothetical protein n=1 Tax=Bradyrhizobium sp. CCGUVB1N3 TaxID=2949629 RepID=UPI0020B357B3|nr:hypothetical protein [Bradyrhizobium sp. CCGUVB1N3]MCP3477165.1 hypothetical protein [Bradyrhizobium sp. CCGUVB1N3]
MANEAFALSPMSARAAEPNEQDYDAIREAFMETARGRWFLGEYAKRNRNADTRMVLDAVAKIEETLAAQRHPVVEDRLPDALVAIRRAIREAETIAIAAVDPALLETSLGPIHRGVRIIKEISWRWREIGADGRICDLIDSQLAAIEAACGQTSTIDPRTDLKVAFDLIRDHVERVETGDSAATHPPPAPAPEMLAMADAETAMSASVPPAAEMPQAVAAVSEPEATVAAAEVADEMAINEAMDVASEPELAEVAEGLIAIEESAAEPTAIAEAADELPFDAAAEAEDEAVLARIALEMAAPDPEFDEAIAEAAEVAAPVEAPVAAEPDLSEPVLPESVLQEPALPEPVAAEPIAPVAPFEPAVAIMERPAPTGALAALHATLQAASQASPLPMPSPLEPSLGATILASGMLQKPRAAANDPLAPIRRMTQAEKIAFFS